MDNLRAGARELAEQSLEKAYADVLENYLTYSASEGTCRKYLPPDMMDGLQKQFAEITQIRQLVRWIPWTLPAMWHTGFPAMIRIR